MNSRTALLVTIAIALIAGAVVRYQRQSPAPTITSFDDCAAAGYPIMESYPAQCRTPDGQSFTQEIGNELEQSDLIRVDSPRPNQVVATPLTITGEARGPWFFEASFPVHLEDASQTVITTVVATAQDDWMTTEFVPFTAEISIPAALRGQATIVLEKSNPSGLPEHDDALRIPIVIGTQQQPR